MAYRMRYAAWLDVLPSGTGQMPAFVSPLQGPVGGAGFAQTIEFINTQGGQVVAGSGTNTLGVSGALLTGDVTTLCTAMQSDLITQMNSQLTRINLFLSGQG